MSAMMVFESIRRGECYAPHQVLPEYRRYIWGPVQADIHSAVAVNASNICEYAHAGIDKGSFSVDDFPAVVPPFPIMWIETAAPSKSVTPDGEQIWEQKWYGKQWGTLFWTDDLNSDEGTRRIPTVEAIMKWRNTSPLGSLHIDPDDVRWIIRGLCFVHYAGDLLPTGPMCEIWILVGRDGVIMRNRGDGDPAMWMACPGVTDYESDILPHVQGSFHAWLDPLLLTVSFMNCRNVVRIENYPKRHVVREAVRRKANPPVKYYTLQIEPMRQVLATEGGIAHNGIKKALHICRGHFSEYTEEKPLFGKYSGRFWIPAHVRGSAEAGKVVKDYKVKAPKVA